MDEKPKQNQLIWIMLKPHKDTVASIELHCGWVDYDKEYTDIWLIDNSDETGDGATTWIYAPDGAEYDILLHDPDQIIAWLPSEEFIYPPWLPALDGK